MSVLSHFSLVSLHPPRLHSLLLSPASVGLTAGQARWEEAGSCKHGQNTQTCEKQNPLTTSFQKPGCACACVAMGVIACCASQISQGPDSSGGGTVPRVGVLKSPCLQVLAVAPACLCLYFPLCQLGVK